ncbi:MAG: AAA family ATPase [Ktedonobacteraceae bacterium]|nr:AAA family ATPase [Ktedonobacteraceae bacterium]
MAELQEYPDLIPWTPVPSELPVAWVQRIATLAQETRGTPRSPHAYALNAKYDVQEVGVLLHSWGLPWQVVIAGQLLQYDETLICQSALSDIERVLAHVREAIHYMHCIEEDDLFTLLQPPYSDMGAFLIAVAIYYVALQTQLRQRGEMLLSTQLQIWQIESVGHTLLNIAKRLSMWYFKREVEDLVEHLCNPSRFTEDKEERTRILKRDNPKLEETRQLLTEHYQRTTKKPIFVSCIPCGIVGLRRRRQDAHTTATTQKKELTGFDLVTFDVIVPTVRECYAALGVFSQLGYIQDRVTDQIAHPKTNGCSHLAMGLILKSLDLPCQIEIATHLMQAVTKYGCLYPNCYDIYIDRARHEQIESAPSGYFWTSQEGNVFFAVKKSLVTSHPQGHSLVAAEKSSKPIVVYEKKRKPVALPKDATALDFAYAVDVEMGERALEAFINNRKEPLFRILNTGDIVEIRTSKEIQARDDWLDDTYARTSSAKHHIRESLKRRSLQGRRYERIRKLLERYHYMLTLEEIDTYLHHLVKQHNLGNVQSYLERLDTEESPYTSEWIAQHIMQHIAERTDTPSTEEPNWVPVEEGTIDNSFRSQRMCAVCQPTYPRDMKIVGHLPRKSADLIVHGAGCSRLVAHTRTGSQCSPLLPMKWLSAPPAFKVAFYVEAQDRRGLTLDITKQIRRHQCVLIAIHVEAILKYKRSEARFVIETYDDEEVLSIWERVLKVQSVKHVDIDATGTPTHVAERLRQKRHRATSSHEKRTEDTHYWDETVMALGQRSTVLRNPYDISHPASQKMFYGRVSEIKTMQRTLCDEEHGKAIIIYGPRRSGKSSLCKNFLECYTRAPFYSVFCSLQGTSSQNEEAILMHIAEEISDVFHVRMQQSIRDWHDYSDSDPQKRFKHVLQGCLAQMPGSRLILALDEFGGPLTSYQSRILESRFFTFWRDLISQIPQLSLILVLPTNAYTTLLCGDLSNALSFAESLPLTFLDSESAQRLLVDPLREQQIAIHPDTAGRAIQLSSGNPYYLNLIGQQLILQLNQVPQKQKVVDEDLTVSIERLMEPGSAQYFLYYRGELQNDDECRVLETITDLTTFSNQPTTSLKRIAQHLKEQSATIRSLLERLRDGLILAEYRNTPFSEPYYAFKIELVWQWMIKNRWFFTRK